MKYAFYPGCVSKGGAPELYTSTMTIADKLGIELEEIVGASCTGAGVLQEKGLKLGDTLNARTFAMAERMGLTTILNICSTCQGVMAQANYRLLNDPDYLSEINKELEPEGLEYTGRIVIKHLAWVIVEEIGIEKLKSLVTNPLPGLKVAPFYGCYILRPSWALGINENPGREYYLEQIIEACGSEPVNFPGRTKCCGFPIMLINEKNSMQMVANHTTSAHEHGADAMVTPCPLCHLNLDGQQPKAASLMKEKVSMPILHLPQMIGLAMGYSSKELGLSQHIVSTKSILEKASIRA
ncbi:MAG: disulfide reductase [Chloroflexi bacterium]|nr:disulfide reductase [Chloroflexota bacterium]|tara:strand:- start:5717 stop:6604 length:888 start_codon:yes stop_codon:yes gene_type:complete